jgi:uncharacterized protein (TIGR04255 family)
MVKSLPEPLGGIAPDEIKLTRSPLTGVVMQVRFSSVLRIDTKDGLVPFQEELRGEFPLLEQVASQQVQMDFSNGAPNLRSIPGTVWRFSNAERNLVLSLSTDTVTLEAKEYPGRGVFLVRWRDILALVERFFSPGLATRLGARYVNRLVGKSFEHLNSLVNPNFIGVADSILINYVTQAISEANMNVDEGNLMLRWGILPPNLVIDPGLMAPINQVSWILDIDVSSSNQKRFSVDVLRVEFEALAARAYAVFRHVLLQSGLEHFGTSI